MRTWFPLYSIQAWGKFYGTFAFGYPYPNPPGIRGYAIYQRRHGPYGITICKMKDYNKTPRQVPWLAPFQAKFKTGVHLWQGLTNEAKAVWDNYNHPPQMTGHNRFLSYYLRDLI